MMSMGTSFALYATLSLKSDSGLWEEFQFSNPERLSRPQGLECFRIVVWGAGCYQSQLIASPQKAASSFSA